MQIKSETRVTLVLTEKEAAELWHHLRIPGPAPKSETLCNLGDAIKGALPAHLTFVPPMPARI